VLKQIKEIEAEREKMVQEEMKKMQNNSPIMLQRPGQEPVQLSNQDVVNMIQDQQKQLSQFAQKCGEFENMITILQKQLVDKTKTIRDLTNGKPIQSNNITATIIEPDNSNKTAELENMITMLQKQLIEKTKTIRELSSVKSQAQIPNNFDDLIKQNNELQKMVGMLQQQLIEKTIALRDANSTKEKMTRIPIQEEASVPVRRSKSDPEVIVDVNIC